MGWIIALCAILGLAILPLGVSAAYNADGAKAYILIGPVRIKVFPLKKRSKQEQKAKPKKTTETSDISTQNKSKSQSNKGGSLSDFLPILELIFDLLGEFRRKLRVNYLQMKLTLANDDPADLAANYGKASAILGSLVPLLERYFIIKKRDLEVLCDFTAEKTLINVRLDLTITVGRLMSLAAVHGIKILRQLLKIMKMRKGGAKT